ncbi:MAG: hypothetical protein IPI35_17975 [Deltaproteobacteria bacterium]|nr:hypothetical protein [Deltaproteobacteria bacterium]
MASHVQSLWRADAVARFDADGARLGEELSVYVSLSAWGFDGPRCGLLTPSRRPLASVAPA